MKISVISCGWYGTPLAQSLLQDGHEVFGTTRSEEKKKSLTEVGVNAHILETSHLPHEEVLNADIIILNLPPFKDLLQWLKSWNWNLKTKIIFISSTSVYSKHSDLLEIENWIQSHFSSRVILRFGGLIGHDRHPGKVLSGRKEIKGPLHPVNLIHRDDCIGFTKCIIEKNITNEIFDVVSDEHSLRSEFYTEYCLRKKIAKPEFDETDLSQGKLISNEKMSALYQLTFSRMIGREL